MFSGHIWGNSRQPKTPDAAAYNQTNNMLKKIGDSTVNQVAYYKSDVQTWYAEGSDKGTAHTVDGYDFKITDSAAPALAITSTIYFEDLWDGVKTPSVDGAGLYKIVLQKLIGEYGFQETKDSIEQKANQPKSYTSLDQQRDEIPDDITVAQGKTNCTLHAEKYSLHVTCDNPDIHTYLAGRMKPFAEKYAAGSQTWIKDIVAGPLVIKSEKTTNNQPITASQTSGYDLAEMIIQMGDKRRIALFYANYNKSSEWHYVTEATDEFGFPCKDIMKNADARKALYNQICYDDARGQVRVDSNERALQ
jgi:hypothetical protein